MRYQLLESLCLAAALIPFTVLFIAMAYDVIQAKYWDAAEYLNEHLDD